jgi:hypothetical protein
MDNQGSVDSAGDDRTVNNDGNAVRHNYRVLSDAEKASMVEIKDLGAAFLEKISALGELARALDRANEARGSGHVGGEARHRLTKVLSGGGVKMNRSRIVVCLAVCLAACASFAARASEYAARAVQFAVSGFVDVGR